MNDDIRIAPGRQTAQPGNTTPLSNSFPKPATYGNNVIEETENVQKVGLP
jgi:hypothetical protein